MITERDLQEAIAECLGQRNPNANTCIKLAAYYTIQQNLFPSSEIHEQPQGYSFRAAPDEQIERVMLNSDSEFSQAVNDRDVNEIMPIWDELMSTLKIVNPRLSDGVMRKIFAQ